MGNFEVDKKLVQTILTKLSKSQSLTNEEETYRRQLFDAMLSSKKTVRKAVQVITGTELRKGAFDVAPMRPYPIAPAPGSKQTPEENTEGMPDRTLLDAGKGGNDAEAGEKLADADNKPKQAQTVQEQLSDVIQIKVGVPEIMNEKPRPVIEPEPATKFVSADPVKVGDMVLKNFAKSGQLVFRGQVQAISKEGGATVRWETGQFTHEPAILLVKEKQVPLKSHVVPGAEVAGDTKVTDHEIPVKKADRPIFENENPQTAGQPNEQPFPKDEKAPEEKPEDEEVDEQAPEGHKTPFEGMVEVLSRVLDLAKYVRECQAASGDDEEVAEYYENLLDSLRETAENVLGALTMEMAPTQDGMEMDETDQQAQERQFSQPPQPNDKTQMKQPPFNKPQAPKQPPFKKPQAPKY